MKKLSKLIAAVVLALGLSTAVASAQSCTIENTGPDSNNSCTVNETSNTNINCSNDAAVINANNQNSQSGDAETDSNTTGGSSTSGSANNSNDTNTNVSQECLGSQGTSSTSTDETPEEGQGAGVVAGTSVEVASLPDTAGENSLVATLGLATVGAGALGLIAQTGIANYRRSQN